LISDLEYSDIIFEIEVNIVYKLLNDNNL